MSIKTIPLRNIEEKVENMYEAVCIMSGQAKRILDERIVQASIKDAEEEDYGVFDEERYFSPGVEPLQIYKVRGVNIGITICEDIWIPNGISTDLTTLGAQVILNLNASPYEKEKLQSSLMVSIAFQSKLMASPPHMYTV